jgi:Xaa-Pro aminopeptidase
VHRIAALFLIVLLVSPVQAADQGRVIDSMGDILPLRERPAVVNEILAERFDTLLPRLMTESGLDMWLVIAREYADDPVYASLVPRPSFTARRTTMLVFHRLDDGTVERLTVARYPLGEPYEEAWSGGSLDEQWTALGALIEEKDPGRIGINVSRDWPVADGLTHGLHERLLEVLPGGFVDRLEPAEELIVRWLETRTDHEIELYAHVVALARAVIAEGFSSQVITPGVTTTDDVAWYLRQRFADLDLPVWFMPYVNIQREDVECADDEDFCGTGGVIHRGDVLHTDVGICYLGVCTDTQEMAYVLRVGEHEVPGFLQDAMAVGNRWQDHLTANFETGRTGNEILAATIADAEADDLVSSTYTHPIGRFGHAPGPTIGMWDDQDGTPVRGDWPLYPNTAYAIEGNVKVPTDGWGGGNVQIKLEQSAVFDGERVLYLAGRQTEWHVVR